MRLIAIIVFLFSFQAAANTNYYEVKLDEFTLAKSQGGITDTIDMTKSVWQSADSLHVTVYICGVQYNGVESIFTATGLNNVLFRRKFTNSSMGYRYSFPTSMINPDVDNFFSMSIGAAATETRMARLHRVGFIKFI